MNTAASLPLQPPSPLTRRLVLLGAITCGLALLAATLRLQGAEFGVAALAMVAAAGLLARYGGRLGLRDAVAAHPWFAWAGLVFAAALLPFVGVSSKYDMHVLAVAAVTAITVIGLNVHVGSAGLINIGYGGIFAVGAYSAALTTLAGAPFLVALLVAVGLCVACGAAIGACAARTRGDYFALVTLGFGLIVHQLLINLTWLTGGTDGLANIPAPSIANHSLKAPIAIGAIQLHPEANFYYLALAFLVFSVIACSRLENSWLGRAWSMTRADPISASCFGINVPVLQIKTVAFGSAFAGVGGALYAHLVGFISPDDFSLAHSIELIAMVILGGIGSLPGVIAGAVILTVVPEKLRVLGDYRLLAYGVVLVMLLIYRNRQKVAEVAT